MCPEILRAESVASAIEPLKQLRAGLAQRRQRALHLLFTLPDIDVDLFFMAKVEGDRPYTCSRASEEKFWRMVSGESPGLKD
jgi:hypothetical protein